MLAEMTGANENYVNYFDIQVLMMVTETKTLTSTLHHNIFTYLDYVFSATFIYIYNCFLLYGQCVFLEFIFCIKLHCRLAIGSLSLNFVCDLFLSSSFSFFPTDPETHSLPDQFNPDYILLPLLSKLTSDKA